MRSNALSAPTPANDDALIDSNAVAKILGVSHVTVERMRSKNVGPSYVKLTAGIVRYRPSAVQAYIDSRTRDVARREGGRAR